MSILKTAIVAGIKVIGILILISVLISFIFSIYRFFLEDIQSGFFELWGFTLINAWQESGIPIIVLVFTGLLITVLIHGLIYLLPAKIRKYFTDALLTKHHD